MALFFHHALQRSTILRALKVAFFITPILTFFNHYEEIFRLELGSTFWFQTALTFLVPYCVSTYSSAMANIEKHRK